MSNTYKHKQMRELKAQMREQELDNKQLLDIWAKFGRGSLRFGNKRKFEADMKVKKRRAEKRNQRQLAKQENEKDNQDEI